MPALKVMMGVIDMAAILVLSANMQCSSRESRKELDTGVGIDLRLAMMLVLHSV
jgi:hypothetical protein